MKTTDSKLLKDSQIHLTSNKKMNNENKNIVLNNSYYCVNKT